MKKIAAILLAGVLVLSACAAPVAPITSVQTVTPSGSPEVVDPGTTKNPGSKDVFTVIDVKAADIKEDANTDYEKLGLLYEKMRSFSLASAALIDQKNYIYSPISVYLALAAISCGAEGEAQKSLEQVLMPEGFTHEDFDKYCRILLNSLVARDGAGYILDINTLVAIDTAYEVNGDYAQAIKDYYLGNTASMKLASQEAVDELNKWTSDRTNGLIDKLFNEPFSGDAVAVLINTVYFLGKWEMPFDEKNNEKKDFHGTDGDTKQTFMKQELETSYAKTGTYEVVRLNYMGSAYMDIYLPIEGKTTDDVLLSLKQDGEADMEQAKGTLMLPKFEAQSEIQLNDILKTMGLEAIFEGGFKGIVKDSANDIAVSKVFQKAKITVDEKGTEAAAATAIEMEATAVMPSQMASFNIVADRPFVYTLNSGSSLLFMGETDFEK